MSDPVAPDVPADQALPPSLRLLKWLVIVLMLTMIVAVITVVALLVTRMPRALTAPPVPSLPTELALPAGARPVAVTFGPGWTAVVTEDDRILIFDRDGALRQEMVVGPAENP